MAAESNQCTALQGAVLPNIQAVQTTALIGTRASEVTSHRPQQCVRPDTKQRPGTQWVSWTGRETKEIGMRPTVVAVGGGYGGLAAHNPPVRQRVS